jgi:6-phosphogluconolactonase
MNEPGSNQRSIDYGERGLVHIVADAEALAVAAADQLESVVERAVRDGRAACVALSGGSTPKRMGELVAASPYAERIEWARLHVFWGDERWVPISDPENNAGEAKRGFLDLVPIPADQIHAFDTDLDDPVEAATRYEVTIRSIVPAEDDLPRFDLVFLGMGDDGHTASLFPGTSAVHEASRLVVANLVTNLNATRLTLTPPLINAAKQVVFLIGGAGKAKKLHAVLDGPVDVDVMPSQIVRPAIRSLVWIVDEAAATQLDRASGRG